jgi:hypothetical protein
MERVPMVKKSSASKKGASKQGNQFQNLPFHSPSFTKSEKSDITAKLAKGEIGLQHIGVFLSDADWVKIRFDSDKGVWLLIHSYTPPGEDDPVGLVTYRAKGLANVVAMAIWKGEELSSSDFESDDDDDF